MLTETIRRAARDFGDRAAFVTPRGRPLSYAQLDAAADEVAVGLRARGIAKGSVVGLVLPSDVDYVAAYLGAARIGAVTAGVNPLLSAAEVAGCLASLQADLVAVAPHLAHLVAPDAAGRVEVLETDGDPAAAGGSLQSRPGGGRAMDSGPGSASGVTFDRRNDDSHTDAHNDRRTPAASPDRAALADGDDRLGPDDDDCPVCVCFTSGSTGAPKGAWFTNRQLRAVADLDAGGAWGGGHGISSTNFAHVAFMTKLPWMLACGRTTHLLKRWSAGPVLELIARHRMAAVTGVAPQIALMVRHPAAAALDFSAVQAVVAGGAASPPELVRAARQCFDAPYSIRYSSTESGGVGLATALGAGDDEACHSVGRPRPGVDAQIRGPEGTPLAPGETGELWLRSQAVMSGYWRDLEATAAVLDGGWLRTGDLASADATGLYRLAGRTTEMFIRGGYNVYPMEVESVLVEHPGVREVAVVGRPDPVMGEIGLAVVAPRDRSEPPTLEDLRAFAAPRLARHKLPEALELVEALPRNSADKVDRRRLR